MAIPFARILEHTLKYWKIPLCARTAGLIRVASIALTALYAWVKLPLALVVR